MRGLDQVHEFFIAQQVGADLRHPRQLRAGRDDVAQERLRALDVDGEVVVDEEDDDLTTLLARVPLLRLEDLAADMAVRFIEPAGEATTNPSIER